MRHKVVIFFYKEVGKEKDCMQTLSSFAFLYNTGNK